jgi:hypothetical protein
MTVLRVDTIAASGQTSENTGSVYFDGTGDYLSVDTNLILSTSNFTVEGWVNMDYSSNSQIHGSSNNDFNLYIHSDGNLRFYDGASAFTLSSSIIPLNTWTHFAVVREGTGTNQTKIYVNGINTNNITLSKNWTTAIDILVGRNSTSGTSYANGYISNLRVIKGRALYTSNFTPPTRELEVTPETVLVCCHDGENIFAEKTGKIIAAYGDRLSSPTPTATDSPIGITTNYPPVTRGVDVTAGPTLDGDLKFNSQNFFVLPKGTTTDRFPDFGAVDATSARGVFMGGGNTPRVNTIDYVTISTLGDATDFGDLSAPNYNHTGGASNTRGIIGGGLNPANTNLIEYITIQSTGNTKDFGDLSSAIEQMGGASNSTRCLFAGGYTTEHVNTIDFITISTSGNTFDFGDLTATKRGQGGLASPNRALFAAGGNPGVSVNIDYVTIMSTGNAVDFGDISGSGGRQGNNGCSTNTRGCWGGGYNGPAGTDAIQYVTIATLGNAQPFGDLSVATLSSGATSSSTRGVWGGGYKPAVSNTIEYITMATLGDANNFGDLSQARVYTTSVSNGHGGLG